MKTIETVRTLLADASPEMRRAVGEFGGEMFNDFEAVIVKGTFPKSKEVEALAAKLTPAYKFFRELIEAGKQ